MSNGELSTERLSAVMTIADSITSHETLDEDSLATNNFI